MADKPTYTGEDGSTSGLDTADALAHAVADMSRRLLALETAPRGSSDPADAARLDRLESVTGVYFGAEFADYEAARKRDQSAS